jgi:hypothetical protein
MQNIHSNKPSTLSNKLLRVDIKPQFLQMCVFGSVSVMLVSGEGLYSYPRERSLTVMSSGWR